MRRAPFPASAPFQHPEARAQASPSHALSLLRRRLDAPREACCAALAGACWLRARPPADRARHRRPNRPPTPTAAPAATLTAPPPPPLPAPARQRLRTLGLRRAPSQTSARPSPAATLTAPASTSAALVGCAAAPVDPWNPPARPPNVRTPFESRHWEPTHTRTLAPARLLARRLLQNVKGSVWTLGVCKSTFWFPCYYGGVLPRRNPRVTPPSCKYVESERKLRMHNSADTNISAQSDELVRLRYWFTPEAQISHSGIVAWY